MSAGVLTNLVRKGFYLDSVALMRLSAELAALPGAEDLVLMMGTEANKQIMRDALLLTDASNQAGANDLLIGVRAESETAASAILETITERLTAHSGQIKATTHRLPHSVDSAVHDMYGANLALISVPGQFAAREARKALTNNLNVMIFSDNVSLEEELALKEQARECGLLVMGPDCGSALLAGTPIAFANVVPQGRFGIVSASGTGLQEVSVLLARVGEGVSHGIGVGGRDLSDRIAGITTLQAIDLLAADPQTEHILLISKPPGPATAKAVFSKLSTCGKPAAVCLFGCAANELPQNVTEATTLKQLVEAAVGHTFDAGVLNVEALMISAASRHAERKWVHGLYSGGTLCTEAQSIFNAAGLTTYSNVPLEQKEVDPNSGHRMIDLGADEYTQGRPHPMIEPTVRDHALATSLADPTVAIVLLDVMLGFGAHADPAESIVKVMASAPTDRPQVVCSVCGTDADPQGRPFQIAKLEQAGAVVVSSNADAAMLCVNLIGE